MTTSRSLPLELIHRVDVAIYIEPLVWADAGSAEFLPQKTDLRFYRN
jgi:hypothetical protein